jgi:hypothetical protein
LENIIEMTFFWLQDAVVLLREHPRLADVDPWRTFLSDATNRSDLKQLGAIILREEAQAQVTNRTELHRQDELLKTVRDGVQLVVPQLDGRLSRLPGDLRGEMEAVMFSQFEEIRAAISSDVQSAMVLTVQKMAAGLGSPFPYQGYRNGRTGPIHHRRYTTAATLLPLHRRRYTTVATQLPLHQRRDTTAFTTVATQPPLHHRRDTTAFTTVATQPPLHHRRYTTAFTAAATLLPLHHHHRYTAAATPLPLHNRRYTTATTPLPSLLPLHFCRYTTAATPLL